MGETDIKYLKVKLKVLVLQEEYEKAARVRDWITELEEQWKRSHSASTLTELSTIQKDCKGTAHT